MGITGLLPFVSNASRKAHVSEWSGCTVAIDAYCWLHRGAFACADRLARGDPTDMHIKYCMKYVNMLLSHNIKPILVFDGRHLPAKAATESKRRESRDIAKKRAAELLRLGQIEEARSYLRRSVDISHAIALQLIQCCRNVGVDCVVAPYEADAQLAFLSTRRVAQLVVTEDSDLILFGCRQVLFKMDLDGSGILVDTIKLPLVMKCPIERYSFDKFRRMCIMSGCDYLASLPGIGLAKARQFVTSTQDPDFANALKKLPGFLNKSQLTVTDEYRESFLRAEATFKHQFVYDVLHRKMVRLTDLHDEGTEPELCRDAGELLDDDTAFQLALGNLDPFTLAVMDDWHPDRQTKKQTAQSQSWKDSAPKHPSMWSAGYDRYTVSEHPWRKKTAKREDSILTMVTRPRNRATLVVLETQEQGITIDDLKNIYCAQPDKKKQKVETVERLSIDLTTEIEAQTSEYESQTSSQEKTSPIIVNKNRSFKKAIAKSSYSVLRRLSKFPRTILDDNVVESKFFSAELKVTETVSEDITETSEKLTETSEKLTETSETLTETSETLTETSEKLTETSDKLREISENLTETNENFTEISEDVELNNSQKENSPVKSPVLVLSRNPFKVNSDKCKVLNEISLSEDSVIECTYPMEDLITPVDSQSSFGETISLNEFRRGSHGSRSQPTVAAPARPPRPPARGCRPPGLSKRNSAPSLPGNQPTLLSKFGFQKKCVLKK